MMELRQETDYVEHHIQKVVGFFTAMRAFANDLRQQGHHVIYLKINDSENGPKLTDNLDRILHSGPYNRFEYQLPDEYRLDEQLEHYCETLNIGCNAVDTEHFYTGRYDLRQFFSGKKQYIMEYFYRHMRKRFGVLMQGGQPEGGEWNFDKSNRKSWKGQVSVPEPLHFDNDVAEVLNDIKAANIKTIGVIQGDHFDYPINRFQANEQLQYFLHNLLPFFGDYQDAMHTEERFLFHSKLSFAINIKLLSPKVVIEATEAHYRKHKDSIHISQVEGFIRQILGWREYMRGMYWHLMPEYKTMNALDHHSKLPEFYWTGETKMNCLSKSIAGSLENAYAHHIQRLMVTGNFALLTGVDPDTVDAWYLGIYIDAVEWVQLTNTRGMSQYADGGLIATKPYVSSGSYINKMSNYCASCTYDVKSRHEANACPFNSLYWHFLIRHRDRLEGNRRMGMMYRQLDKMNPSVREQLVERAESIMNHPDAY